MARDDTPPFQRGETWYNGTAIDATDDTTLGGVNLEGKEFVFEPASHDQAVGTGTGEYTGRPTKVKVVRNVSGVNLKPGRIAHWSAASTSTGYGTRVDGYCIAAASVPAGIVDELLPAAGVPNNDLFYLVVQGPTQVTNQTAAPITTTIGARLVPAATGATAGDDLGGRVALQDLTGATAVLGVQILNKVGVAASVNSTTSAKFNAFVDLRF